MLSIVQNVSRHVFAPLLVTCWAVSQPIAIAAPADDLVIETFEISRHPDIPVVPVTIGKKQYKFFVDTGCTEAVIDEELAPLFRRAPVDVTLNGQPGIPQYLLHDASVGESKLPLTGLAAATDLSLLRAVSGHDVQGVIGMDFLKSYVVQIDFDAARLSLLKQIPRSPGASFRLAVDERGVPLLFVEIEPDDEILFIVDTGSKGSALTFSRHRFDELVSAGRLEVLGKPTPSTTFEGESKRRSGRLNAVKLSQFQHENISVAESDGNKLGIDLLSRYRVTFDFPNNRMYLKPGQQFDRKEEFGRSGAVLVRVDGKIRIHQVEQQSSAEQAGIRRGDEVFSVNGEPATSLSLAEIRENFRTVGQNVKLEIRRPDGRHAVEFRVPEQTTELHGFDRSTIRKIK